MAILINPDDKTEITIKCSCSTPEHNLFLHYYPEDWPEIYVTARPDPDYSFWERIKTARKYIFSNKRFSTIEMVLDNEDIDTIIKFLNDFKENTKDFKPEDLKYHEHILKNPLLKVLSKIVSFFADILSNIETKIDKHRVIKEKK